MKQRSSTTRALLAIPEPSTGLPRPAPPILLAEPQPRGSPSGPATVIGGSGDGTLPRAEPIPMETEVSGQDQPAPPLTRVGGSAEPSATLRAAVSSADVAEQDHPAAPEVPVEPATFKAPTVESEDPRECSTCHGQFPLAAFVGVSGQRTSRTCHRCCV